MSNGTTTLISKRASGGPANDHSREASISDHAELVAFSSQATDLAAGDASAYLDVFVWTRASDSVSLVTQSPDGDPADGPSRSPSMTGTGSHIAFASSATNLIAGDTNAYRDVFLYSMGSRKTRLISHAAGGGPSDGASYQPSADATGARIAFSTEAANVEPGDLPPNLVIWQAAGDQSWYVQHEGYRGTISRAGNFVAWVAKNPGFPPYRILSFAEWSPGSIQGNQACQLGGERADRPCLNPDISGDGRFVVYASRSSNLVPMDENHRKDVFIWHCEDEAGCPDGRAG
jgi:hypothetical protein